MTTLEAIKVGAEFGLGFGLVQWIIAKILR